MLFVYEDAEKRRQFKNKYCDYKFVGPSFLFVIATMWMIF